jgi:hypothetical protein
MAMPSRARQGCGFAGVAEVREGARPERLPAAVEADRFRFGEVDGDPQRLGDGGAVLLGAGQVAVGVYTIGDGLAGAKVEWRGRGFGEDQDGGARARDVADAEFVEDIGIGAGQIGQRQIAEHQAFEHLAMHNAADGLLIGAERL